MPRPTPCECIADEPVHHVSHHQFQPSLKQALILYLGGHQWLVARIEGGHQLVADYFDRIPSRDYTAALRSDGYAIDWGGIEDFDA